MVECLCVNAEVDDGEECYDELLRVDAVNVRSRN